MNALASEKVGDYLNDHFYSASQKVGTFRVVNGQKQGGNVASYFCRPDGTVVHAVPGPVKADEFLKEARWAVEADKLAATDGHGDAKKYRTVIRKAHLDRLQTDFGVFFRPGQLPLAAAGVPPSDRVLFNPFVLVLANQAKASVLLAAYPVPKLADLYPIVWERVLGERVSLAPVKVAKN